MSVAIKRYMKKWLAWFPLVSFLLLLLCCANPNEKVVKGVLFKKGEITVRFPGPEISSSELPVGLRTAENLVELLPLERLVLLETTDQSILAQISGAIFLGNTFIVLDSVQEQIYQFKEDGTFLRVIGGKGEGPGEYQYPFYLHRCWDDEHFSIADLITGKVIVYNQQGEFITSTNLYIEQRRFLLGSDYIWTKNRFYLAEFPTVVKEDPRGVIFNCPQGRMEDATIECGFGSRQDPLADLNIGGFSFTAFAKIKDTIWAGSPYSCKIDVFSLDGQFLFTIDQKVPFGLTIEDYDDFIKGDPKEKLIRKRNALAKRPRNLFIHQVGKLVVVNFGNSHHVYDVNGNLLKENLGHEEMAFILDVDGNKALSFVLPTNDKAKCPKAEWQAMVELGLTKKNINDFNPFLRIGRLVD